MRLGALHLFERGHRNGEADRRWLLAALHWRWSITWRWLIDWTPWSRDMPARPLYWWFGNGSGAVGVRVPLLGQFHYAWQKNMRWKRPCTCHPDDNPPKPCQQKFALGECREAARRASTRAKTP